MKTPEIPPALCDRPLIESSANFSPLTAASGNLKSENILLALAIGFTRRHLEKARPPAGKAAE